MVPLGCDQRHSKHCVLWIVSHGWCHPGAKTRTALRQTEALCWLAAYYRSRRSDCIRRMLQMIINCFRVIPRQTHADFALGTSLINLYNEFTYLNYINTGMPNLRKIPFSTDCDHLFESTDKKVIYGRIYGCCRTRFGLYPPPPHHPRPHCTLDTRGFHADKQRIFGRICGFFINRFGYYPPPPPDPLRFG